MNKNLTTILTAAAIIGAGYFIYQNMRKGQTTTTTTTGGGYGGGTVESGSAPILRLVPPGLSPQLKRECDESYSSIGVNRYLCYRGLKEPKYISGNVFL